jgi:fucose 4-O-acetylase-like acetyltransferase
VINVVRIDDGMSVMNDQRDKQVDAIKGFAIILVVVGHVIAFSDPKNYHDGILINLIYSFHMPLFFFISGYLVFGRYGPTVTGWIGKKFRQLIIPYTLFTLFYFFILSAPLLPPITPVRVIQVFFSYTEPASAWFLPVLFESFIFLALCIEGEKKLGKSSFGIFFFLVCGILPLTFLYASSAVHQIVFYTPFVILGYLASEYKGRILRYMTPIEAAGSLLFFGLFVVKFRALLPAADFGLYYLYVTAATGIIFSWFVIKKLMHFKASCVFIFCGILSMEIYLTHLLIIKFFSILQLPFWYGTGIVAVISGTVILLVLSVVLSLALSYNRKFSTIIFGRWSWKILMAER